jgi:hypothetical protein
MLLLRFLSALQVEEREKKKKERKAEEKKKKDEESEQLRCLCSNVNMLYMTVCFI